MYGVNSNWKELQSPNVKFDHDSNTIWADVFVFLPVFVFELVFVKVDRDCQTRAIQAGGHNRDCWQLTGTLIGKIQDSQILSWRSKIVNDCLQDCQWLSSISSMIVNLSQVVPNLCLVRSIWGFLRLRSRGLIFVWGTHPVKLFVTWNLKISLARKPSSNCVSLQLSIVDKSSAPMFQLFNCSIAPSFVFSETDCHPRGGFSLIWTNWELGHSVFMSTTFFEVGCMLWDLLSSKLSVGIAWKGAWGCFQMFVWGFEWQFWEAINTEGVASSHSQASFRTQWNCHPDGAS